MMHRRDDKNDNKSNSMQQKKHFYLIIKQAVFKHFLSFFFYKLYYKIEQNYLYS